MERSSLPVQTLQVTACTSMNLMLHHFRLYRCNESSICVTRVLATTLSTYCCADGPGQQDGYLISSSSSAVNFITLCSDSSDYFISQAAQNIYNAYDHAFSGSTDNTTLLGHTITSTGYSTLNAGLLNVVSLSRSSPCLLACLLFVRLLALCPCAFLSVCAAACLYYV